MRNNISQKIYNKFNIRVSGFTLVELIVVIAIIALLTAIITANFTGSKAKSRDAQRISDLGQLQLALGLYFDRCGQYPLAPLDTTAGCPANASITFGSYISKIPTPPSGANQSAYDYLTNASPINPVPSNYALHAKLEGPNAATINSLTDISGLSNFNNISCYSANNPLDYCIGPK